MMIYLMLSAAAFSELPVDQESVEEGRPAMVLSYSLEDFLYIEPASIAEEECLIGVFVGGRAFARPANQRLKVNSG